MAAIFTTLIKLMFFAVYCHNLTLKRHESASVVATGLNEYIISPSLFQFSLNEASLLTNDFHADRAKPASYNSGSLALCLIILSGDISLNPGPQYRHPRGTCSRPVKSNQKGLQCDSCDTWYHTRWCFLIPGIIKLLNNINPKKANGPDLIPCRILKEAAVEIAPFLQFLFSKSMESGAVPSDWLKANVTSVFKKGSKHLVANYRPISLTAVPCKILEHIIFHNIMAHLDSNNILVNSQHGFRKKLSCETQLITTVEEIAKSLDNGKQSDLIIMDFSKAFDVVPHQQLVNKLDYYGIRGHLKNWITTWLTLREQSVVVDGVSSPAVHVSSGVPQELF